ncbi:hypothetical protein DEVEQU_03603 [Devosia equisanguinis]|uniref:CsgH-like domain-containing protein n=1 Tax=Devosia equisanguinis TaxID=2490941 RepID=A0A447IG36_9HYPH|nr:curli-like amyloid fiber formation chaperone CsgH [Devosia equisanguinis]VDS06439.1 hypothetical protein DEVEQU_03603 [Devosia equisanguinis]
MIQTPITIGTMAALAISLAALGAGASANAAGTDIACGVSTKTEHGMLAVEGVLQSPTALNGEYRFALKSSGGGGSTNVSQGGAFSAAPDAAVSLGRVMVNAGSKIDVDFSVTANGKQLDCSQQFAART